MPIAPVRAVWTARFENEQGQPDAPGVVVFHVEHPDGTTTDYTWGVDPEVTNPAVGRYVLSLIVSDIGATGVRVSGTVGLTAQAEAMLHTTAPRVA